MFIPELVDYNLPRLGSVSANLCFVSIKKTFPMQARKVMNAIWSLRQLMFSKIVVIVDEEVNVQDEDKVWFYVGANVDPGRDVVFCEGPLDVLDHAAPKCGVGHKMGIDATRKLFRRGHPACREARRINDVARGQGLCDPALGPIRPGARLARDVLNYNFPMPESISPPPVDKSEARIRQMFGEISPRYDFLNHFLSGGADWYSLQRTVRAAPPHGDAPILDVCTGTGDLALAYFNKGRGKVPVVGTDFTQEMLQIADKKGAKPQAVAKVAGVPLVFLQADTQRLPFADEQFQIVCVAFGLRNVTDTSRGLREMIRVCLPGGKVVTSSSFPLSGKSTAAEPVYLVFQEHPAAHRATPFAQQPEGVQLSP